MTFNPPTFSPPLLATGQNDRANGRQQLGNGLVTHRGLLDTNNLRAQGYLTPQSGAGLEVSYNQSVPKVGYLQSYDRDAGAYTDLNIFGKNVTLVSQAGGKVTLPQGTAQALIGQYFNALNWSLPATSQWFETPIQASFTNALGGMWRIEFLAHILSTTAGAGMYLGLGVDGSLTWPSMAVANVPAGWVTPYGGVVYHGSGPAGAHRVSVFMQSTSAGGSINASGYNGLWVTEQRA